MGNKIDGQKLKALLENEELMKKLSDQSATSEDYAKVFKVADIELTEEETRKLREQVIRIVSNPDKVLNDAELTSVMGGGDDTSPVDMHLIRLQNQASKINLKVMGTLGTMLVGGTIGCSIASKIVKDPKKSKKLKDIAWTGLAMIGAYGVGAFTGINYETYRKTENLINSLDDTSEDE